jgi:hypothetical protein
MTEPSFDLEFILALIAAVALLVWRSRKPGHTPHWAEFVVFAAVCVFVLVERTRSVTSFAHLAVAITLANVLARRQGTRVFVIGITIVIGFLFNPCQTAPWHFVAAVVAFALAAPFVRRLVDRENGTPGSSGEAKGDA